MIDRLQQQLNFIRELEKLKTVLRATSIVGGPGSRRENSAEHSWQLALMAYTLKEHCELPQLDIAKCVLMLLLHDVVEIDAGDVFCYDQTYDTLSKKEAEKASAKRVFNLLPSDQAQQYLLLWEEFEAGVTSEARFAKAIDRLQPVILNDLNNGGTWKQHNVEPQKIKERIAKIKEASNALYVEAEKLIPRS